MNASPKYITSAANPLVKMLKSLALKKHRDDEGLFIVEGTRHIADALAAGWAVHTLALTPDAEKDAGALLDTAAAQQAQAITVPHDLMQRITGRDNTQGIIAALHIRTDDIDSIGASASALWLGLEDIRDPGNLGTIIRTADAVGVAGVVLIGQTCDPFSPEAIRASMGSFARPRLIRISRDAFAAWRPSWTGHLIGTHLKTDTDYRQATYDLPLMLVMGSEQNGLSAPVADLCDTLVKIPMPGGTESLNLGVSTGIMLYEICRNRL